MGNNKTIMKKVIKILLIIIVSVYLAICALLYFFQEKLIFHPEKVDKSFKFEYNQPYEEMNIKTQDNILLNGLLFKADSSKGLIFYLHGNGGTLTTWGNVAKTYTDLNYDVFILDYRGYGKSEGNISSQEQIFKDIQTVYDNLKTRYEESKIIVLGYSIGTGLAAKVASANHPKMLILQAPYISLTDMMRHSFPIFPTFLLKYKFETDKYINDCKMPIVIFHGNKDKIIYYESSLKLKELMKPTDKLIILEGQGHNGMTDNPEYKAELRKLLME
jgi:pimeloyl-ACP methyl ester carboxylesterase